MNSFVACYKKYKYVAYKKKVSVIVNKVCCEIFELVSVGGFEVLVVDGGVDVTLGAEELD